jgi:hypothetical protein
VTKIGETQAAECLPGFECLHEHEEGDVPGMKVGDWGSPEGAWRHA